VANVAGAQEVIAVPVSDLRVEPTWSAIEDPETGYLIARFPRHVSSELVAEAIDEIAHRLVARNQPTVVVADLLDVEGFDAMAPIAAIIAAAPIVRFVERVELIVRNRSVRLAALTAARVLSLRVTVRLQRSNGA
jgi:hypothetical protein